MAGRLASVAGLGFAVKFRATPVAGVFVTEIEPRGDDRGFFARAFCQDEFRAAGLEDLPLDQFSVAFSPRAGTLRGMHYQAAPHTEVKYVRCVRGAVYDVALDLRPDSPTYLRWFGVRLDASNHEAIYVPRGIAHGYLTLEPDTEVFYQISPKYAPGSERGVRFDDPAFGIVWPAPVELVSERDRTYPDYRPVARSPGA